MSRHIQIRIVLEPVYRPDLRAHFPKLAKALEELEVQVDERRTTLYHLIRELQRAMYGEMRPALRHTLGHHLKDLVILQKAVEEKLAAWKFEGLDALLYRIEDAFEALERDLD